MAVRAFQHRLRPLGGVGPRRLLQRPPSQTLAPSPFVRSSSSSSSVVVQAIEAGEWVVVKETGRRARVVSKQSNGAHTWTCSFRIEVIRMDNSTNSPSQCIAGWWRLEEEGEEGRIISARTGSLLELDGSSSSSTGGAATAVAGGALTGSTFQGGKRPQVTASDGTLLPLVLDPRKHPLHAATRDWVVFSDLHCSVQTLATCREVRHDGAACA
jgi:hypothetical protein